MTTELPVHAIAGCPFCPLYGPVATISWRQVVVSAFCHQKLRLPELSMAAMTMELPVHAIAGGPYCPVATVSSCQVAVSAFCHQYLRLPEKSVAVITTELPVHAIVPEKVGEIPVATVSRRLPKLSTAEMITELPVQAIAGISRLLGLHLRNLSRD